MSPRYTCGSKSPANDSTPHCLRGSPRHHLALGILEALSNSNRKKISQRSDPLFRHSISAVRSQPRPHRCAQSHTVHALPAHTFVRMPLKIQCILERESGGGVGETALTASSSMREKGRGEFWFWNIVWNFWTGVVVLFLGVLSASFKAQVLIKFQNRWFLSNSEWFSWPHCALLATLHFESILI